MNAFASWNYRRFTVRTLFTGICAIHSLGLVCVVISYMFWSVVLLYAIMFVFIANIAFVFWMYNYLVKQTSSEYIVTYGLYV